MMQTVVLLACFIAAAASQQLADLTSCGRTCVQNANVLAPTFGCATADDPACLCANRNFFNSINCCSFQSCDLIAARQAVSYVVSYCATVGVDYAGQDECGSGVPETSSSAPSVVSSTSTAAPSESSVSATESSLTPAARTEDTAITTSETSISSSVTSSGQVASITASTSQSTVSRISPSASSTISSTGIVSPTVANTSVQSSSESNTLSSSQQSSELSLGAKIGIGVGAGVGVLIFLLLVFCLLRRRRNQKKRSEISFFTHEPEMVTNRHQMQGQSGRDLMISPPNKTHSQGVGKRLSTGMKDKDSELIGFPYELSAKPTPRKTQVPSPPLKKESLTPPNKFGVDPLEKKTSLQNQSFTPLQKDDAGSNIEHDTEYSPTRTTTAPFGVAERPISTATSHRRAPSTSSYTSDSTTVAADSTIGVGSAGGINNLDSLRAQMQKVRAEKERLRKLHELEEQEADLMRRIQEEERRSEGRASR